MIPLSDVRAHVNIDLSSPSVMGIDLNATRADRRWPRQGHPVAFNGSRSASSCR